MDSRKAGRKVGEMAEKWAEQRVVQTVGRLVDQMAGKMVAGWAAQTVGMMVDSWAFELACLKADWMDA